MNDIHKQLKETHQIAAIWGVDDVISVRSHLTPDEAWEVLKTVKRRENANTGITWDHIESVADEMYPEPHIIITVEGVEIDMSTVSGAKGRMFMIFKDSKGGYHAVPPSSIVEGGTPIENDGPNEGDDMEYVDIGFEN